LVGVEAFAARSIETAQQLIEAVPQCLVGTVAFLQSNQQFQDQPLERGGIIRQLFGRERRQGDSGVRGAHTLYDA
jgi:hypothetical protein